MERIVKSGQGKKNHRTSSIENFFANTAFVCQHVDPVLFFIDGAERADHFRTRGTEDRITFNSDLLCISPVGRNNLRCECRRREIEKRAKRRLARLSPTVPEWSRGSIPEKLVSDVISNKCQETEIFTRYFLENHLLNHFEWFWR